jgi:C-terminal processing protease CtpA/Prc
MKRMWMAALVAAVVGVPAAVAAQQPAPAPAPAPRARVRPRAYTYSFNTENHGRIGVVVNTAANADSDRLGARIEAVTPGGPADKAGLKEGDIITKFNGTVLSGARAGGEDESGPGMKLVELAHALDPGDTVKIEYRRGADTRQATLVAEEVEGPWAFAMPRVDIPRFEIPRIEIPPMAMAPRGGMTMDFCFGDSWCNLQLVNLNADLGEYFGTKEGVLVVRAPEDSTLPLKSGDVIITVGGRKATSPEHAMRILRSYDAGETVAIEVMRHQRKLTLNWTVPSESDHMHLRTRRPRGERGEPSVWRWRLEPRHWKLSLRAV